MPEPAMTEMMLLYAMVAGLPLIFVAVGAYMIRKAHASVRRAIRVRGRVVAVDRTQVAPNGCPKRQRTLYQPVFEYIDVAGTTRRARAFLQSSRDTFMVGTEREILINPEQPDMARVPGFMAYGMGGVLVVAGLFCSGVALAALSVL